MRAFRNEPLVVSAIETGRRIDRSDRWQFPQDQSLNRSEFVAEIVAELQVAREICAAFSCARLGKWLRSNVRVEGTGDC